MHDRLTCKQTETWQAVHRAHLKLWRHMESHLDRREADVRLTDFTLIMASLTVASGNQYQAVCTW